MDLGTLIAVATGWLLNELSQFFRRRRENRMALNQALFAVMTMVFVLRQKGLILASIVNYAELTTPGKRIASSVLVDDYTDTEAFRERLRQSIDIVARYDPFIAMDLRILLNTASTFAEKDTLTVNEKLGEPVLEIFSKAVQVFSDSIEQLLLKLAFRTNLRLWLQLHYRKWKERKEEKKGVADSIWPSFFRGFQRK